MIIKKAKKNEPWEVESFWEWIPKEKRKMKEDQEFMQQKILPFEKIYTKEQSKSKDKNPNKDQFNLRETLNIKQCNLSPSLSKERPQSANYANTQVTKNTLKNNFMKENAAQNIFQQKQMGDELKPYSNKEQKRVEEEKRKIEEFRKFQTEAEAKNKNKNLLLFNARFSHKKIEDLHPYRVPNGWEKTPLIEDMPQSPPKGRIPDDLLGQTHIEGNKIKQKQKIVFYKEDKNEAVSAIEDDDDDDQEKEFGQMDDFRNNKDTSKNNGGGNILTNKKLQEQRESVKIQKEINKLLEKNKQINPKTGKEAFGVHKSREVNQFMDMRKMMKVSTKIDTMFKKIKDRGFPASNEFADDHMEEMDEIRGKLENRSIDEQLEQDLVELEYDEGMKYEDILKNKEKRKKGNNTTKQNKNDDDQNFDNGDQDLFGEEEAEKGDQAIAFNNPKTLVKKTTFLTQEKVETVPTKISKQKNVKLKSSKAQLMEDLMNELDLGDDQLLQEYDEEVENSQISQKKTAAAQQEQDEEDNLSDQLEHKQLKSQKKAKTDKYSSKRVQFYNGKMIRKPLEEEDLVVQKQSKNESLGNVLEDVELNNEIKNEERLQEQENKSQKMDESENKSQKSGRDRHISQNDTGDIGEAKKQLWQQDILQGHHRAYLDDNQNFDTHKFVQDVDEETRDKCKEKVQADIKKLEDRTNKKIELIKGGSTYKRSQQMKEKSEKLEKINSRFQKSIKQFKQTIDGSKKETTVIERKPSEQKLLEKTATKILKETQKNSASQKQLKMDNATVNELVKHEFKFSQREKANDDEPHPWM